MFAVLTLSVLSNLAPALAATTVPAKNSRVVQEIQSVSSSWELEQNATTVLAKKPSPQRIAKTTQNVSKSLGPVPSATTAVVRRRSVALVTKSVFRNLELEPNATMVLVRKQQVRAAQAMPSVLQSLGPMPSVFREPAKRDHPPQVVTLTKNAFKS